MTFLGPIVNDGLNFNGRDHELGAIDPTEVWSEGIEVVNIFHTKSRVQEHLEGFVKTWVEVASDFAQQFIDIMKGFLSRFRGTVGGFGCLGCI